MKSFRIVFTFGGTVRSHGSILNQILRPTYSFPQRLKSVRIISFAFLLDGSISKAAHRGTQTFDCIIPETQGFPQSVFQRFSLCIECLLSRRRNRNASREPERRPCLYQRCYPPLALSERSLGSWICESLATHPDAGRALSRRDPSTWPG